MNTIFLGSSISEIYLWNAVVVRNESQQSQWWWNHDWFSFWLPFYVLKQWKSWTTKWRNHFIKWKRRTLINWMNRIRTRCYKWHQCQLPRQFLCCLAPERKAVTLTNQSPGRWIERVFGENSKLFHLLKWRSDFVGFCKGWVRETRRLLMDRQDI